MNRWERLCLYVAGAVILLGVVSSCAGSVISARYVNLPNGKQTMCVFNSDAGVSCDWSNQK